MKGKIYCWAHKDLKRWRGVKERLIQSLNVVACLGYAGKASRRIKGGKHVKSLSYLNRGKNKSK